MNEKISAEPQPNRILLATDLSARCDRALDRAAQLAGEWSAELVALNVLNPAASPDRALAWASGASDEQLLHFVRQELSRDLSGLNIRFTLQAVRNGDAASIIRDMAISTHSGLVVTGVARNEIMGRFLLGSTVERLARTLPQPLLVVRNRVRAPYQRIVVATDFSESSRHTLQAAVRLFPGRELIVYHAYEIPLPGLANNLPHSRIASFLDASGLASDVKMYPVIERGTVEIELTQYVRQHDIDLVAMGAHGSSGIMSILLGTTAGKLLNWLPCDTLLVREEPRAIR